MPVMRLFVYPCLAAIGFWFLTVQVLKIKISGPDSGFEAILLCAVPFLYTFFSQLHRLDVLSRLERLEKVLERQQPALGSKVQSAQRISANEQLP